MGVLNVAWMKRSEIRGFMRIWVIKHNRNNKPNPKKQTKYMAINETKKKYQKHPQIDKKHRKPQKTPKIPD